MNSLIEAAIAAVETAQCKAVQAKIAAEKAVSKLGRGEKCTMEDVLLTRDAAKFHVEYLKAEVRLAELIKEELIKKEEGHE